MNNTHNKKGYFKMNQENIQEIWRDVVGFESHYEISNLGNIRRKRSKRQRMINYAQIYPTITLSANGVKKTYRVHRIVAKAFLPAIHGKSHVNHKNGDKTDNRAINLEWVTQAENNLHAYRELKRRPSLLGVIPANRKVVKSDIPTYHELNMSGMSTEEIGRIYGINGSTIRKHLRKFRREFEKTAI